MTPELKDNTVVIYCRGMCGRFYVFKLDDLERAIQHNKSHKDIRDFADYLYCGTCSAAFAIAIENLGVKPLTLNGDAEPH